jgi:AraC family transcriptional regulator, L-rhamnose operon transcriptional activator RhaR
MAWLAQTRAERAAYLLARTGKPVSEIAIEVGWPDPVHFARRFRAHFGVSASAYRDRALRRRNELQAHPDAPHRWAVKEQETAATAL